MMYFNIVGTAIVVFIVIIFFVGAVIVNGLTKSPDNIELPDQCSTCHSNSCYIKFDKNPKPRETIQEYYKKCEENDANKEKK